jgi:hypothetical protein
LPTGSWLALHAASGVVAGRSTESLALMKAPSIVFETASNGWLPVRLELNDEVLGFAASDVADNPLEQLCNSLLDMAANRESTTEWFLEPDRYEFLFSPTRDEVSFAVELVERRTENLKDLPETRRRILSWSGPSAELFLSFWRALKKREHSSDNSVWPVVSPSLFASVDAQASRYKHEG